MRLDKRLSSASNLTRSQAGKAIRAGEVNVDGELVRDRGAQVADGQEVTWQNVSINAITGPRYYMLNKPAGQVCANADKRDTTIFDELWITRREQLHVAGRLDKDTTGLLLLTDDGQWSHRITSPRHQHFKTYLVTLRDELADADLMTLENGILLSGEKKATLPAKVERVDDKTIRLSIAEGRHHQVKRMLLAVENEVVALHRESMGQIKLDETLEPGGWRELTESEIQL